MARRVPLFLKRRSYRQRRLRDAARLLPLVGMFLLLVPLIGAGGAGNTAGHGLYLFLVWLGLVAAAAALSAGLGSDPGDDGEADSPAPPDRLR